MWVLEQIDVPLEHLSEKIPQSKNAQTVTWSKFSDEAWKLIESRKEVGIDIRWRKKRLNERTGEKNEMASISLVMAIYLLMGVSEL